MIIGFSAHALRYSEATAPFVSTSPTDQLRARGAEHWSNAGTGSLIARQLASLVD
jgi:hypothetical protein